jgi:flagellar biogenesis protein FliO
MKYWTVFFVSSLFASEEVQNEIPLLVENVEGAFFRMVLSLFAFVLFGGLTLYFLRRFIRNRTSRGPSSSISVIERKALSPKSMLYLVKVDQKKLLICESQLEVRLLDSTEKHPPKESSKTPVHSILAHLEE